jgi:hypothetical protein
MNAALDSRRFWPVVILALAAALVYGPIGAPAFAALAVYARRRGASTTLVVALALVAAVFTLELLGYALGFFASGPGGGLMHQPSPPPR